MRKDDKQNNILSFLSVLGVIFASISIFNLIRRITSLEPSDFFQTIISTYELFAHTYLFDSLFFWLYLEIPLYFKDLFAIWLVCTGLVFRTIISIQKQVELFRSPDRQVAQGGGGDNWLLSFTTFLMNRITNNIWPFKYIPNRSHFTYKLYIFLMLLILWPLYLFTFVWYDMDIILTDKNDFQNVLRRVPYRRILVIQFLSIILCTLIFILFNAGFVHM